MNAINTEACVISSNAREFVDFLCKQVASLCVEISHTNRTCILCFVAGRALLRSADNGLMMRVEAYDLIASHSIQMVLEGYLFEIGDIKQTALLWIGAEGEPFAALTDYCGGLRRRPEPTFSDPEAHEQKSDL